MMQPLQHSISHPDREHILAGQLAMLEERLQDEINRRISLEQNLAESTHHFEKSLQQRTELLQELVMQLQTEIGRRDEVESQLRKRTDVMHDFIKQLEQEMEERRTVEANMRSSEQRFRSVIEKSPVGICITNNRGVYEYVNPAYCSLFGYAASELTGKPVSVLLPVEEVENFEKFYGRVLAGAAEMRGERTLWTKDHRAITVLTDSVRSVKENAPNEADRSQLVIFALDITERKHTEDVLRRAKVIIDQSPAVIYQFSLKPSYPLEFVSDNIRQFGFTAEEFTSGVIAFMHHVHPDDRERVLRSFKHLSQSRADHLRREYRLVTSKGYPCWVEDNLMAVHNTDGTITSYQGVLFDIDERKRAEEEMNKALLKEKELVELKSRFVTIASHEFRTPLTSILLSVGILKDFGSMISEEERLENFTRITGSVNHMTGLLQDLLLFGRAEAGHVKSKKTTVRLRSWCDDFAAQMQERYGSRRLLMLQSPESDEAYSLDENLVRQILEHLLSNADKYSPEGKDVLLDVQLDDGNVIIHVQDNGMGIPSEDLPRVFEPFHRGANIGNIGGTGMGLAVVQKLVGTLGGTISVQSDIGKGTTVTILLPLEHSFDIAREMTTDL
jgi:PAS domain S-box-containing protein